MPLTPEALDTAIVTDRTMLDYAIEHFYKMRLHAIQIENLDLTDLYARVQVSLSNAKECLPPD